MRERRARAGGDVRRLFSAMHMVFEGLFRRSDDEARGDVGLGCGRMTIAVCASDVLRRGLRTLAPGVDESAFDQDSSLQIDRRNRTESRPDYTLVFESDDSQSPREHLSKMPLESMESVVQ